MILLFNGEIASVDTWGDGQRVAIFDRLFLGGANNLRGFNYRDVGPKDVNGEPLGGKTLARATVELTFPIIEKVRAAVFYDIGFVEPRSFNPGGRAASDVGVGLRLDLPIGPLRLDYGFPSRPAATMGGAANLTSTSVINFERITPVRSKTSPITSFTSLYEKAPLTRTPRLDWPCPWPPSLKAPSKSAPST